MVFFFLFSNSRCAKSFSGADPSLNTTASTPADVIVVLPVCFEERDGLRKTEGTVCWREVCVGGGG